MDDGKKNTKESGPSKLNLYWRRVRQYPPTLIGVFVVVVFVVMALFATAIAPYNYQEQNTSERLQPPSIEHIFGTDNYGRDIFSRIVYGSRNIFLISGSATALAVALGLCLGLVSAYRGGLFDDIVMRFIDIVMSVPALLLAMVVLFSLGSSIVNLILVVGLRYFPMVARVVRSVVLDLKTRQFVEAAKLRGESSIYIMFREIMPNVLPPLAVEASMRFVYTIFLVASLGFLGLGVQPPAPDWGMMVNEARMWFYQAKWLLLFPAGAIALFVVGMGFLSDGLRRMLLPGGVSGDY